MALNPLVDTRDSRFVLFEMLKVQDLSQYPKFKDFDRDTYEEVLNLAEKIAVDQVYPANAASDKEGGAKYDPATKAVRIPPLYKPALQAYHEAGFMGMTVTQEEGGMGMPDAVFQACTEYFTAASVAFSMYPALTLGAMNLVRSFGTQEQKDTYVPKMLTGEWGGTMCLTEPDAGSDVGALKTRAVRQKDGTFLITGQKIFISSGDNDCYASIVHPVLARIEGDPAGTKGISIFVVPKFLVNKDGSLGKQNDVVCSGIEHKMGIKSSATCSLSFGDNGKCIGYLLGQERQGMKIMFQMMNEARLYVGLQGLAVSSAGYMHAVTYAKNRVQGSHVSQMMNPDAPKTTIINHPDVRKMLLWMKSYVEGMRALGFLSANCVDLAHAMGGEEKKEAQALLDFLIPICKAGNTDASWMVTSEAIQVYGGYGFCSDYPVEQYARDSKILSLYEGTNGIQSMDLVMRKLLMNPEQYSYSIWKKRVAETAKAAKGVVEDRYIAAVENAVKKVDETVAFMKDQMAKGQFLNLFSNASQYRKAMFIVCLAWLHLWSMTLAAPKMKALVGDKKGEEREKLLADNADAAFYTGKVLSGQFFIGYELPQMYGLVESILAGENAMIKASNAVFTGALEQ
jgi:alkylation response protein AidB-like acyl-CoA dehydrogenase